MPPRTTTRRTTTNLKTKNNQKCQKIKLHGSLTTKELKKKYSIKLVGGAETGSQGREDSWKGGGWWTRWSHICVQINWEEQLGSKTDPQPWVLSQGNKASKPLTVKPVGVAVVGETPSLTGEFIREPHRVPECTQSHPPKNQHKKGPICLWVVGEVPES